MSRRWNPIALTRDCTATTVPAGQFVLLSEGGEVEVVQRLGASITVRTEIGTLLRIEAADGDALGLEPATSDDGARDPTAEFEMSRVLEALREVYDPEIPVNIVDLGLVYLCELEDADGARNVKIKMTLTAPGCGMGPVLASDVKSKVESLPGVKEAEVEVVFDPVWDRSMMSEAAKLQLGMYY